MSKVGGALGWVGIWVVDRDHVKGFWNGGYIVFLDLYVS